jgi:hypothetical protein
VPFLQHLVYLLYKGELLAQGQIPGELVAPVGYLGDRLRLVLRLPGVYLDHPDLIRPFVGELFDRGFCEKRPSQ